MRVKEVLLGQKSGQSRAGCLLFVYKNTLLCINMHKNKAHAIFNRKAGKKLYKYRLKSVVKFIRICYNSYYYLRFFLAAGECGRLFTGKIGVEIIITGGQNG